jgi:alkanesulfonate monooxygenase SsuD/methylene tetrahydromethanopterin reductase-like flavin-dependent oxidoreductase (luciferase family)
MHFDLFFEIPVPALRAIDERTAYAETLAQIELGDRLGFDCAWLVEHHFTREYSHCSKPELVLAAASQRTTRIRMGHAIVPLPLHHPLHVAERAATLDLLSAGRLELGIGRGFAPREYAAFGRDMADSRALVNEALLVLRHAFRAAPFAHDGRHWQLPACDVLPKFVQAPHPPLWSAAVSPETFTWAARQALGVLIGPFKPWPMVRHDIRRYLHALAQPEQARIGLTLGIVCLEDGGRARQIAEQAFRWFYHHLYGLVEPVLEQLYPSYEQLYALGRFRKLLKAGIDLGFLETFGLAVAGTPAQCVRRLRRFQAAGVTRILCAVGAGAVEPNVAAETMQLIAREVRPALESREPSGALG